MNTIDLTTIAEEAQRAADAAHPELALVSSVLPLVVAISLAAIIAAVIAAVGIALFGRDDLTPRRLTAAIVLSIVLVAGAFTYISFQQSQMDDLPTLQSVCKDEWGVELLSAIGTTDAGSVDVAHDPVTSVVRLAPLAFEARWENPDRTIGFGRLTLAGDGTLACYVYPTTIDTDQ